MIIFVDLNLMKRKYRYETCVWFIPKETTRIINSLMPYVNAPYEYKTMVSFFRSWIKILYFWTFCLFVYIYFYIPLIPWPPWLNFNLLWSLPVTTMHIIYTFSNIFSYVSITSPFHITPFSMPYFFVKSFSIWAITPPFSYSFSNLA